ncbi:TetR/AcrR family transcriptional regulator [Tessaracoccus sp. G1721]
MGTGKRGPYAPGVQRREAILDAAASRFAAEGFAHASLADIARDAGVTGPGVRHYFASKDEMLLALAERRFAGALKVGREWPVDEDGTGTLRLMLRQVQLRAEEPELIEVFVRLVGMAAERPGSVHVMFAARYDRVIQDLVGRFRAACDRGVLRRDIDYESVVRDYIAVSDGLQVQWVLSGGAIDMVALMRRHLERVAPEILTSGERIDLAEVAAST